MSRKTVTFFCRYSISSSRHVPPAFSSDLAMGRRPIDRTAEIAGGTCLELGDSFDSLFQSLYLARAEIIAGSPSEIHRTVDVKVSNPSPGVTWGGVMSDLSSYKPIFRNTHPATTSGITRETYSVWLGSGVDGSHCVLYRVAGAAH